MSPSSIPLPLGELEARILYEDDGLVVIDKPWGIPSTGRDLDDPDSVQFALMQRHGSMTWAVHQLDADTSGINVFVRRKELVAQWKQRMTFPNGCKTYLAMVHGVPEFDFKRVDKAIGVISRNPTRQLGILESGQPCVSELSVIARGSSHSLLEISIETGRTHQIRIHLSSLGHPLVGEEWYRQTKCCLHPRQALHAWKLEMQDAALPDRLHCPLPGDLRQLMKNLGLEAPGLS
jgi:23S rRNA-/tRNA-specific pseudouridylate synthase